MKRKKLWIMVLTVILCLTACLVGCNKAVNDIPAIESVSISNKTALQSDWYEGGADRTVELTFMPNGVSADNADVKVVSNRPQIISVDTDGRTLKALSAGSATITVTADDKSDSVLITVKPTLKEVTITNKAELSALWVQGDGERTIEVALRPDAFTIDNTQISVVSSDTNVISVDGMKLNTVALGTSTITVSAGGYSDTVNIEVIALSNPELKLTGETTLQGVTDSEIELPVIATSCDGKDLSEYVTVDCQDGRLTYNKSNHSVSVTEKGEYTLTLTVKDPRDESKTDSETFTVNAYRKVFNAVDGYGMAGLDAVFEDGKEFVEDSEQVAYFNRSDATFAQFNMQPSKVYYAEVTLTSAVSKADWSTFFGMNHSVKGDTTKWLTSFIDRGDAEGEKGARNFRVKYSDMVEDNEWWNLNEGTSRTPIYYSYRIYQCRELNDGGDAFPVTLAVARIGDWFYSFVNGDYVNAVTNTNFENVDTVAGVYQQSAIRANYTNIKWLTGKSAEDKVNELTANGKKVISPYVIDDGSWCEGSHNYDNKNFTVGEVNDTDGINYTFTNANTDWNGGMVSPFLYFDGDFTFEWTFKFDESLLASEQKSLMRMWLDVRSYKYQDECVRFGAAYGKKDSPDQSHLFAETVKGERYEDFWHFNGTEDEWGSWWNGEWTYPTHTFKFTISRICLGDKARFVMKWTAVDQRGSTGEGTSNQFVWEWDGYNNNGGYMWDPCGPVILLWHHVGITGKCTNVNWSVLRKSVEITNKTELNDVWAVGDSDRTVDYQLAVGMEGTTANVTSSNPEIVKVADDGKTLKAIGAGTATITVSVGDGISDEITITVIPALTSVAIDNKTELQGKWVLGENTREVSLAFNPAEYWNENNSDYKITSNNPEVISVNGKTLTAAGAGTATITVTAKGQTDTVEISVLPVLNSVEITNKDELNAQWVLGDNAREVTLAFDSAEYWNENNCDYTITSSNTAVITANGKTLTAVGAGTTTVTVTAEGKTDEIEITVRPVLTGISIDNKTELQNKWVTGDADRELTLTLTPSEYWNADNTEVTIQSSNSNVISVDETTGKLTAVAEGKATITVSVGTIKDSVEISVENGLKSITITNKDELMALWLVGGSDRTLQYALNPTDAQVQTSDISVTSDNTNAVTVDGFVLKAVGAGQATITITAKGRTDTVDVLVRPALTSVSISNKTDLEKTWNIGDEEREVSIAFDSADYWNENNTKYTVTTSNAQVISVNGKTLTAVGKGTATITVTAQDKSDTVDITVSIGNPTLEFTGGIEAINAPTGKITLPEFTASNYEGKDISDRVTVACLDSKVTVNDDKTLSVSEKGTYTVTLTVSDERDTAKTAETTLTVRVIRNVFNAVNGDGTDLSVAYEQGENYVDDDKQIVYIDNGGITFGQFDMQPGKQYYAAVTFTADSAENWNAMYGMSHSVKGDAPTSWLSFFVDRGPSANARNAKIKYFDMSLTDTWKETHPDNSVMPIYVSNQIYNLRGLDNAEAFPVKFETVRNGDFFYFFINGKYVMGCTDKNLKDKDTLPGIFQFSGIKTGMTAIEWISGSDAVTKFNDLTDNGNKLIGKYKHADWVSTSDDSFAVNGKDAGNVGFAFNNKNADWNDGLLSQYMYFDGDFTYEWTYKFTDCNGWSRMTLNIANFNSTSPFIQYGAVCSTSNTGDSHLLIETAKGDSAKFETGWSWNNTGSWGGYWGSYWQNPPEKIKFKVTRVCTTDGNGNPIARYVFTMTALNIYNGGGYNQGDVGNSVNWVFDWDGKNGNGEIIGDPCGAVIMNFCNYKQSGECSNMVWTAESTTSYGSNTAFYFGGDFTFEYDYEFAEGATGSDDWSKSTSLSIKNLSGDSASDVKIVPMAGGSCWIATEIVKESEAANDQIKGDNDGWNGSITDKYHIKVQRKCNEDGSVVYTFLVMRGETAIINDSITRQTHNGWGDGVKAAVPVCVWLANNGIDGTFSNVTWSATADNA